MKAYVRHNLGTVLFGAVSFAAFAVLAWAVFNLPEGKAYCTLPGCN